MVSCILFINIVFMTAVGSLFLFQYIYIYMWFSHIKREYMIYIGWYNIIVKRKEEKRLNKNGDFYDMDSSSNYMGYTVRLNFRVCFKDFHFWTSHIFLEDRIIYVMI